jgi:hypothetical protein
MLHPKSHKAYLYVTIIETLYISWYKSNGNFIKKQNQWNINGLTTRTVTNTGVDISPFELQEMLQTQE